MTLTKKNNYKLGLMNEPVLCKSAVCGDTKLLGFHILHRELLFWDCIHFVLQAASSTGQ